LLADPDIAFIEKDQQVRINEIETIETNSPLISEMKLDSQTIPWGVHAIGASITQEQGLKGSGIKVAILDTGITVTSSVYLNGGISFVEGNDSYQDDHGHGTHMAGIISGSDNGLGVMGVAPQAQIYAVKVLNNQGIGTYSQVIEGIDWAIEQNIDIISISFGGLEYSQALHDAINDAIGHGIIVIASAGNRGDGEETEVSLVLICRTRYSYYSREIKGANMNMF
jgi:subtilisin family serine protease